MFCDRYSLLLYKRLYRLSVNTAEPTQVQTYLVDPAPGHVSPVALNNTTSAPLLMYSGFNGQFLCEYQPWFYPGSSHSTAANPGYNELSLTVVNFQDSNMITRGCAITFVDFYGTTNGSLSNQETVTNNVSTDVENRGEQDYPLKLGILEDVGAFNGTGSTGCNRTGLGEMQTSDCIETALDADMDYINSTYVLQPSPNETELQPAYWVDGYDGQTPRPVVGFFGACTFFAALTCPGDWDTIWTAVTAHTGSYAHPFKFIFQFGSFTSPQLAFGTSRLSSGEYGWPQPAVWN